MIIHGDPLPLIMTPVGAEHGKVKLYGPKIAPEGYVQFLAERGSSKVSPCLLWVWPVQERCMVPCPRCNLLLAHPVLEASFRAAMTAGARSVGGNGRGFICRCFGRIIE
jgi:hypothetical protein